ncbi:unnamed protein product [Merluccius merluccius]
MKPLTMAALEPMSCPLSPGLGLSRVSRECRGFYRELKDKYTRLIATPRALAVGKATGSGLTSAALLGECSAGFTLRPEPRAPGV